MEVLSKLEGNDLYLNPVANVLDFTNPNKPAGFVVQSREIKVEISLNLEPKKLKETLGAVQCFLGGEKSLLIMWKAKELYSYALAMTGSVFSLAGRVIHLDLLESYLGVHNPAPQNFAEALQRLKNLSKFPRWKDVYRIHEEVFLPLVHTTIPRIETVGLVHKTKKARVFPHYEIDGQSTGRLKCESVFTKSVNPHTLSSEEKSFLRPPEFDHEFIYFDYSHMEPTVLAWLSQDCQMQEMLLSGEDFYSRSWELLTQTACNPARRQMCKEFLLPSFYGMGASTISQHFKWPIDAAQNLIKRIANLMPQAWAWAAKQQNLKDGWAEDHFGRRKHYQDKFHKARGFAIQAPAALICIHKLNILLQNLHHETRLLASIHDGFVVSTPKKNVTQTIEIGKALLEGESELCSGLKLKCGVTRGESLDKMITVP